MALNNFDDDSFNPDLGPGGMPDPGSLEPENKPSGGKTFIVALSIIGVILILALVLLLLVAPGIISQQRNQNIEQAAQINAANTATAMAATANALPQSTATPVDTLSPTGTPVVSIILTSTPVVSGEVLSTNEVATVQALQTQMAGQNGTGTPQATATALPTTGFADEYGLPGVVGLAVILIAVVFLSRKLRTSVH
jgi:hypothetical protein